MNWFQVLTIVLLVEVLVANDKLTYPTFSGYELISWNWRAHQKLSLGVNYDDQSLHTVFSDEVAVLFNLWSWCSLRGACMCNWDRSLYCCAWHFFSALISFHSEFWSSIFIPSWYVSIPTIVLCRLTIWVTCLTLMILQAPLLRYVTCFEILILKLNFI